MGQGERDEGGKRRHGKGWGRQETSLQETGEARDVVVRDREVRDVAAKNGNGREHCGTRKGMSQCDRIHTDSLAFGGFVQTRFACYFSGASSPHCPFSKVL